MRTTVLATAFSLCLVGLCSAQHANASIRKDTNIPSEPLGSALETLAKDYDFQVLYRTEIVKDRKTQGAVGSFTSDEALTKVLSGTGLSYKYLDASTVTIVQVTAVTGAAVDQTETNHTQDDSKEVGKKSSLEFRLAQATPGHAAAPAAVSTEASSQPTPGIQEIIVTAQKRSENLLDVPVPVTAISAQTLVDQNQLRLMDYYTRVPGLTVATGEYRDDPMLAIRGVTTGGGQANPTVGVVIDDVPFGSSTGIGGGNEVPDLDPSDLAQVEVLRGPQGTLYGASSIGGLLKYVTVDPSTDSLSGNLQAATSGVYNGAELGYSFRGAVNVPLSDTSAIRASAFTRLDPGYVDNVTTGQNGVNEAEVDGGRFSALWRPSETLSIKLSALIQDIHVYGSSDVEPDLGDLKQSAVRGTGTYDKNTQAYSAIVSARFGTVDFTSLTGYNTNRISDAYDYSAILGPLTESRFGVTGSPTFDHVKTNKFSQEFRLSTPVGQTLEWLVGAFYTHESTKWLGVSLAAVPSTGAIVGTELSSDYFPTTYEEYAAFTNLTVHFTDRFNVQLGGRESENRQSYMETITGPFDPLFFGLPSPVVQPEIHTKDDSFTYLVTPQFKFSADLMAYARLASGYRPGGPNPISTIFGVPNSFKPDTTRNYEIGTKGDLLGNELSFDASVYYIDWKDIQIQLAAPVTGATYFTNASSAKSQGIELTVDSRPITGLTVSAWVAWNDAVLTSSLPPNSSAYGLSGDRLPFSSHFSGNFGVEEDFPVWRNMSGLVGGSASYIGDREGFFSSSPQRQDLPGYAQINLRTGVKDDSWTVNLFANNVADKRGLLSGGLGAPINPFAFTYIQPRTIGLAVTKTF